MQATAGPFPGADAAPTQPQGCSVPLCGVNTWEEHTWERNGRFWGEEAFLRSFLLWQCQLSTVPYSVPCCTVYTVKYGRQNSKTRRCLQKNGPYRTHCTVPSDRLSTSLVVTNVITTKGPRLKLPLCQSSRCGTRAGNALTRKALTTEHLHSVSVPTCIIPARRCSFITAQLLAHKHRHKSDCYQLRHLQEEGVQANTGSEMTRH